MTEMTAGIYQLKIPLPNNPLGATNVYLVKGDKKHLLIDAGWDSQEALQALQHQLAEINVAMTDIAQIVITHAHFDHYGLANKVRELSGATVALHYLEQNVINSRYVNLDETVRQVNEWLRINGVPADDLGDPHRLKEERTYAARPPDIILRGDEVVSTGLFNLQIIWTPGHWPGHVCLYEPDKKVFFSGDHILPEITPNISLQTQYDSNPLGDFIKALKKLKPLEVKLVLPAHQNHFTDLPKRIDEILRHHERREAEIMAAINGGQKTAFQIAAEITWMPDMGGVKWHDLTSWNRGAAVLETLAHLEAMRVDRQVVKSNRDSIIYYQPA